MMGRATSAAFFLAILGSVLEASPPPAAEGRVFHVCDFGAVPDGKTESGNAIRATIAAAMDAAKTSVPAVEVALDAGTYRVRPERPRGYCFPIHQAANLTVRGVGKDTKIVIADPAAGGFSLALCQKVCVADLVVDYDPVPFCQGTIRAVDVEAGFFEIEVEAGYPTPDAENFAQAVEPYGKWGMIMDPATRRIRSGTPDHYMTPRWEHRAGRVWRFFTAAEHYRRNLAHRRVGDAYNLDACRAGFRIRGNHMRGNRRYGCLLRAGGGVVENNTFEDTTGAGVVLTNEPDWPEGPVPWGITIRGNRFLRGGTCLGYADSPHGAALSVRPARLGHGLADAEAIRDVVIENNEFQDRAGTALFVGGASNVSVRDNRIRAEPTAELRRKAPAILIERSSRVTLSDITVSDPRPGTTAGVEIGPTVAPAERGTRISRLNVKLDSKSRPVIDRRHLDRVG